MKRFLMSLLCVVCVALFIFLYSDNGVILSNADNNISSSNSSSYNSDYGSINSSAYSSNIDIYNGTSGTGGSYYNSYYNKYNFSYKYITDISVVLNKASVKLFISENAADITIITRDSEIKGTESGNLLKIGNAAGSESKLCNIDIYIPDRIYKYNFTVNDMKIELFGSIKGVINIKSENLNADINSFCGEINCTSKTGYADIKGGDLQTASSVTISDKGNIYLSTRFSDESEKYIFYTGNGLIKIQTVNILNNTVFDVYAIVVNGGYSGDLTDNIQYGNPVKVELNSANGIVSFN